jgi:hypothetical protein
MERAFPSHLVSFRQRFVRGPLPPTRSRTAAPSLAEVMIKLANKRHGHNDQGRLSYKLCKARDDVQPSVIFSGAKRV